MAEVNTTNPGLGIAPSDILRAIFRYKWLILICLFLGLAASAAIYVSRKPVYRSTAKLVVRYIAERRDAPALGGGEVIRAPDSFGQSIINTEMQILTSWDLAVKVVDVIGPEKLFPASNPETNRIRAAAVVSQGIQAEAPLRSSIIVVSYQHQIAEVAPLVLRELVQQYLAKHFEIHRAGASIEYLDRQAGEVRARLSTTEEELRRLKSQADIISLEDSRRAIAEQLHLIRTSLYDAEALLAERRAVIPATVGEVAPTATSNEVATVATLAPEEVALYGTICDRLRSLKEREFDLLTSFTGENALVIGLRKQIADVEKQKKEWEEVSPGLLLANRVSTASAKTSGQVFQPTYANEIMQVAAIEAKIKVLTNQFAKVKQEAKAFDDVENQILDTQRRRDMEETKLKNLESSLEQARVNNLLDSSKMSNINIAQLPSPPVQDSSARIKSALVPLVGGLSLGLVLALLLDLIFDQSIRKRSELEKKYRLPVFLTIPAVAINDARRQGRKLLKWKGQVQPPPDHPGADSLDNSEPAWESPSQLRSYYEGLRDRILIHFENVTRRPKLIGLSGCTPGSGATTLAAGLAAALSETGDGNVLLVDLNLDRGTAHPFHRGKPLCGLADVLEQGKRDGGLIQDNLFLASADAAGDDLHPVLSKRVVDLMPRLRASDYDYIIFDLPSVSPTSITFRLAGYMDLTLVVVESSKTSKHAVKDAVALLSHAKAKVGAILNKYRTRGPSWLSHDS